MYPPANNHTRETATPYAFGTSVRACLRGSADVNFYQYTVPSTPAKGGYVIVRVTDVDPKGNVNITTQAVDDPSASDRVASPVARSMAKPSPRSWWPR